MATGRNYDRMIIKVVGDADTLPLRIESRTSIAVLFLTLPVATLFVIAACNINAMVPSYLLGAHEEVVRKIMPLALAALAARWGLLGVFRWLRRDDITIDGSRVSVVNRLGPWKSIWQEPLASYEGVRWKRYAMHRRSEASGSGFRTRYHHVIELVHPSAKRTIPLFVRTTGRANALDSLRFAGKAFTARNASATERADLKTEGERLGAQTRVDKLRVHWEGFAALLGLPAIDARDGVHEVRSADELDQTLAEHARAGNVEATWRGDDPPASLVATQHGDRDDPASQALQVTLLAGFMPAIFYYIFGGVAVLLLVAGVITFHFGAMFGALLFGGAGAGLWYLQRKNPRQLTVTRNDLRYEDPMVSSRSFTMALSDIESVHIRNRDTESTGARYTGKLSGRELFISSDQQERAVGGGLPNDALQWLHDYLIAAIAKA